jgi:ABC-type branched-subunit amino acid transport system substrate-binding protein
LRRLVVCGAALAAVVAGAGGCGAQSKTSQPTGQPTVSLWSAATAADYRQVNAGAKLALAEHGGKAGPFRVNYAAREVGEDPARTTADALNAARMTLEDTQSSAMLADAGDAASRASITLLNQAGVPTVSLGDAALKARACSPKDDMYPNGHATAVVVDPAATVPPAFAAKFRKAYTFAPDALAYRGYLGANKVLAALAARGVTTSDSPPRLDRNALAAELVRSQSDCG